MVLATNISIQSSIRQLKNKIAALLLAGLFIAVSCTSPSVIFAADIGSHLGEGDATAQASIMDLIGSQISDEVRGSFPVTVQVYLGDTDQQTLNLLANATRNNGLFPIIRVNKVCEASSVGQEKSFINMIRAESAFGPDAIIAWGNEVNNEDVECANGDLFSQTYKSLGNAAGPSALDFYNSIFPADDFLSNHGAAYDGAPYYFANAYGCIGDESDSCNPATTTTQAQGYSFSQGKGNFYMTEFSLSPGDGSLNNNAPDTNLRKVVDFIETRAAETGAAKITPLIRNVCGQGGGKWLIFISSSASRTGESQVFTSLGTKIDIDTCSADQQADEYYLYPIPGLYQYDQYTNQKDAILDGLLSQGYQAQCLSPQIEIEALIDSIPDYLYNDPFVGANEILQSQVTQETDFSSARIPGWRVDGDHEIKIINSLETLFGYRDLEKATNPFQENNLESAPIYRSLSPIQICVQQSRILDVSRNMCNKLLNPGACALNKPIENSDFDIFGLQAEMNARIGKHLSDTANREQARVAACKEIVDLPDKDPIVVGLRNTPLFLSNAYRLGFLVMTAELQGKPEGVDDQEPFRFLRTQVQERFRRDPMHEVRVFAFRIPDIGMNRDPNSDIYYQDPIEITRNTLLTKKQQEDISKQYDIARFSQNVYADPGDVPIKCIGTDVYCSDGDPGNPIRFAFAEFVNFFLRSPEHIKNPEPLGSDSNSHVSPDLSYCRLDPDQIPYEKLGTIFSSAAISETEGRIFNDAKDQYVRLQENGVSQSFPIEFEEGAGDTLPAGETLNEWDYTFDVEAKIRQDNPGAKAANQKAMNINAYLIIPQGFQLGATEDAIAGSFMTNQMKDSFFAAFEKDVAPDNPFGKLAQYFKMENVIQSISSIMVGGSKTIVDTFDCQPTQQFDADGNPITEDSLTGAIDDTVGFISNPIGVTSCKVYDLVVNYKSDQTDHAPRIHGNILGQIMLERQLALNPKHLQVWKYIDSCKNIEEFILGSCAGPSEDDTESINPDTGQDNALTAVAQCTAVNGSITSYTTGESAQHIYLSPLELETINVENKDRCARFDPDIHYIANWRNPNDMPWPDNGRSVRENCELLFSPIACAYPIDVNVPRDKTKTRALIANPVDSQGNWLSSDQQNNPNAVSACEYVVTKAQEAGVSPRFALAMWGEESGFSHFRTASGFGIVSQPALDLSSQVSFFLNTVTRGTYNSRAGALPTNSSNDVASYTNFLRQFSGERTNDATVFCNNAAFPGRLKSYYDFLYYN